MTIIYTILSYFLGAVPTGYILFRLIEKKDIRSYGSQATGATNVLRLKGWKIAIPVAMGDVFKGFLPVWVAFKLFPDKRIALLCGFLAVLGHCFPIFIKFRGGKGVATAFGAYLATAPIIALLSAAVFLSAVLLTRLVSLGSILAMTFFPVLVLIMKGDTPVMCMSLGIYCLIIFRHKDNLKRLLGRNERKLGKRET